MIYIQNEHGEDYQLVKKGIIKPNWRSIIWKLDDFYRPIENGCKFELVIDENLSLAENRYEENWISWVVCIGIFDGSVSEQNIDYTAKVDDIPEIQGSNWNMRFALLEDDMKEAITLAQEAKYESNNPYKSRGVSRGMF